MAVAVVVESLPGQDLLVLELIPLVAALFVTLRCALAVPRSFLGTISLSLRILGND